MVSADFKWCLLCPIDLSIDAMDISGEHHLDVLHSVYKTRLSENGQPIHEETEQYELGASQEEGVQKGEGGVLKGDEKPEENVIAKKDTKSDGQKCGRWVVHV